MDNWTDWPSREALNREGLAPARRRVAIAARYLGIGAAILATFGSAHLRGWSVWLVAGASVLGMVGFWGFLGSAPKMRIERSLAWLALVLAMAMLAVAVGAPVIGLIFVCGIAMGTAQRMPLVVAVPTTALATVLFLVLVPKPSSWLGNVGLIVGLGVMGYVIRLDWEARATTQRLLTQERAARAAEAESAALAERARIAREIHDVLAHSLSAQLVHLEAARLMLDAGADRAQLRERIVAARRMAQDGLAETRQALSALRGEFAPVSEFLESLARNEGAALTVEGEPRPLAAEAGVAVRRTVQEALTNARKHAPGAVCAIRLSYLDGTVELAVRNGAVEGRPMSELAESGSGLGLLGMRERAELLGGTLDAGPDGDGFKVLLTLPV
ncbi:signal transduction histidine kinase [Streptacidiphilus sp. MAP12-16]|uniref:sensor histidine kinase n=1 Tax=Streptacidiphilus sp. MAP12-16 TaxID=3156300 RepID=UPI003518824B